MRARARRSPAPAARSSAAAVILYVPLIAAGMLWVVWHWRHEMAAWLAAMVPEHKIVRRLKLDTAKHWWIFGLIFYGLMGLAAVYAALTQNATASRGLTTIESAMLLLLLFETLMHRITRHIVSELPMAGDVVADCLRLVARLYVRDPGRRGADGAGARLHDGRGMAAARSRRQARRHERGGDLCLLAVPEVPHGFATSPQIRCPLPTPPAIPRTKYGWRPRGCAP